MGVLNLTPDSFSDGGQFLAPAAAADHARLMCDQGADIIDIGAESTRPGSGRVPADQQIERVLPVLQAIGGRLPAALSIDTTRAAVAKVALDQGTSIVNDISAGRDDPELLPLVASHGAAVILMHMQGDPATMQAAPQYRDVVAEVADFLRQRHAAAEEAGIPTERILLDPGIGFGKTVEHNLELLRRLPALKELGRPLVVGTSRKGFVGRITGEQQPRLFGTAATVAWSVANGAAVVRVHDVQPMRLVVRMIEAIRSGREG